MKILRIRHITLAVRDLDQARATFEALLGEPASDAAMVQAFGIRAQDLPLGEDTLQLAAPLEVDTALMRFIERRGEGVYNIALEVEDLDATVAELAERGIRVSEPVEATPGLRSAFITMSATHGMSVQLVQDLTRAEAAPIPPAAPELEPEPELAPAPVSEHAAASSELAESAAVDEPLVDTTDEQSPPPRALDLTPDEWDIEEWSDTD